MNNDSTQAEVCSNDQLGGVAPENDNDCPRCDGGGLVRLMTSHLGPDDYEYDEQCPDCAGSGSANPKTAILSLPYSLHRVRGCQVIERAAVLRIIDAHLARLKTPNAKLTGPSGATEVMMSADDTNAASRGPESNDLLGAWLPIASAPTSGLIWLAVEDEAGERRAFAAEASHEDGAWVWMVTTGWGGWKRLHHGWTPILWQRPPQAPNAKLTGPSAGHRSNA